MTFGFGDTLSDDDVRSAYRLLLGREPETGAAEAQRRDGAEGLAGRLVASSEFLDAVREPDGRLGGPPRPEDLAWVARALGLPSAALRSLQEAPSRLAALAVLVRASPAAAALPVPASALPALDAASPREARKSGGDDLGRALGVCHAYQMLLGRQPEGVEVVREKLAAAPVDLALELMRSAEFERQVVEPALDGTQGWIDSISGSDPTLVAWLGRTFGVDLAALSDPQPPLGPRRSTFALLFGDPGVRQALAGGGVAWERGGPAELAAALLKPPAERAGPAGPAGPAEQAEDAEVELIRAWGGFDEAAYRARHAASLPPGRSPIEDYVRGGEAVGRKPNPLFDAAWVTERHGPREGLTVLGDYLRGQAAGDLNPGPAFDAAFYRATYAEELGGREPLAFYRTEGWRRGHDPNPAFDTAWYVERHDVEAQGDPLSHYLLIAAAAGFEPHPTFDSGFVRATAGAGDGRTPLEAHLSRPPAERRANALLDPVWYLHQHPELAAAGVDAGWHHHRLGWREGWNPSVHFDVADYLERNQDVRDAGVDPVAHYVASGAAEGRSAGALFDEGWYARSTDDPQVTRAVAVAHYMSIGFKAGLDPNPFFDGDWYLARNPDVAERGLNPLVHYLEYGWREGRDPNPLFDVAWYLKQYPQVEAAGWEPLSHYIRHGAASGYDPGPDFDAAWYAAEHPESATDGWSPLAHHLHVGRPLGRATAPDGMLRLITVDGVLNALPARHIDPYASWREVNPDGAAADADLRRRLELVDAGRLPKISVVMPCYDTDPGHLAEAVESVLGQVYGDWELCLCDDASPGGHVAHAAAAYARLDPRVRWTRSSTNGGIAAATNRAAELATGEVIALLDHDDLLHPHALGELALAYAADPEIDLVYTDDDKIGATGERYAPQFKPGWSPTLLLSFMYMSHLFSFRRRLFEEVGGVRLNFDGSQDFDLALRLGERARGVRRIPRILYHWRAAEGSTALSGDLKPEAYERARLAVEEAFARRGAPVPVVQPAFARDARLGVFEPVFPDTGPRVTIVIPTRNRVDLLRTCVESLRATSYRNFDVLIVDNESDDQETLSYMAGCGARVLRTPSPPEGFSFAHIMNAGVRAATGEYVLLLNNDTEVRDPRWLSQMVGYGRFAKVGAVGARLLYADRRLQHGGITHGLHEGLAGHAFKLLPEQDLGYLQLARVTREVSGVTAACMLTPRSLFLEMGGLDEAAFRVAYNDVDYCYRLVDAGYSCIQCGSAELFHYEGMSRGFVDDPAELTEVRRRYAGRVDPFYNPNLTLADEQFGVARTHVASPRPGPVRTLFVSHNLNHEGAPNSLLELATGLKAVGRVDPLVISPTDGPLKARYAAEGVPAEAVESPLAAWPAPDAWDAGLRRMAQTFLYTGAEVVVVNTPDAFWAVEAARRAGLPCLWIIRESEPWRTYFSHFPRHIAQTAYEAFTHPYRVVFVAGATLEAWRPLDGRGSFTLVRNGLDVKKMLRSFEGVDRTQARELVGAPEQDCVFTCVGTVSPRKGQLDLVRALAALPRELALRSRVLLVGDRPNAYSAELHEAVAALEPELRERVRIVAETSSARSYLVGSDVFVCASRVESYPRVTLEAMAAGLPLITTGVWGIREQVRADYNARLYEPGDVAALAAHMAEMICDPHLRRLFGSRGAPVFQSLPDFAYMGERYAELIDQAVGSA